MENSCAYMAGNNFQPDYIKFRFQPELTAYVDTAIKSLIPWYLDYESQNIKLMLSALDHKEFSAIARLGDMMKGRGGSYGFNTITKLGRLIENAAENHDSHEIYHLIEALDDYLKAVQIVYITR